MSTVLDPVLPFAELARLAAAEGWRQVAIPGLYPPLRPGEPELARFERGEEVLTARYNPAVGLRVLEGGEVAAAPLLGAVAILRLLESREPESALRGILAAAEAGLAEARPAMAAAAARLEGAARKAAYAAIDRMGPATANPPETDDLPDPLRDLALRAALAGGDAAGLRRLAPGAVRAGPFGGAVAAVAAARLGLGDLAPLLERRFPGLAGLPASERQLCEAIRLLALRRLAGSVPGEGDTPDERLFRAMLGRPGADRETLAVASLCDPLPPRPVPARIGPLAAVRVDAVAHWLGHDGPEGRGNPIRRWRPPRPYGVAIAPLPEPVAADGIAAALEAAGPDARLPTADEWEAALRGPDGRPRPWGRAPRPAAGRAASPWGAEPGPKGGGEWALGPDGLVVCGADRSGLVAIRRPSAPGESCRLRPVAEG